MDFFSVREAYKELEKNGRGAAVIPPDGACINRIWKASAPLKARVTAWRFAWNRLLTKDNVSKRVELAGEDERCCCCSIGHETTTHLFIECD